MNIKKTVFSCLFGVGIMFSATGAYATGIPVLDGALLENDTFTWVRDTMTELDHHIQNYETLIRQYEQMYNQFNYLKNQYTGLVDNFRNIHNLQDIINTYNHITGMYTQTVSAYNNFATTTNANLAGLCGKLESQTLDMSACSNEVKTMLASMNETKKMVEEDNNPDKIGSTAYRISQDQKNLNTLQENIAKRTVEEDSKEGNLLKDLRSYSQVNAQALLNIDAQLQKQWNAIQELRADFEKDRVERRERIEHDRKVYDVERAAFDKVWDN